MKRLFYILAGMGLFLPLLAFADTNVSQTAFQLFNPSAIKNGTDLSIGYLGDIYGVVDGVLHGSGSQVMGKMFMVFNAGALILGGIIVIYTSLISLMNTANEGEMLGKKWNSIWIPLRTVMGIALLIPKSTGYCAIQIFMMWVIVQGVGLADNVWNSVVGYLAQGGVIVQQSLSTETNVFHTSRTIFRQTLCLAGLQAGFEKARAEAVKASSTGSGVAVSSSATLPEVPNFLASVAALPTTVANIDLPNFSSDQNSPGASWNALNGVCGTISWNKAGSTALGTNARYNSFGISKIEDAYKKSVQVGTQQMLLDLSGPATTVINNFVYPPPGASTSTTSGSLTDYISKLTLENASQDYEGIVYPAQRVMVNVLQQNITMGFAKLAMIEGWIDAGSYYSVMTQQNNSAGAAAFIPPSASLSGTSSQAKMGQAISVGPYTINTASLNDFINQNSNKKSEPLGYFMQTQAKSGEGANIGLGKSLALGVNLGGIVEKIINPLLSPLINIIQGFVGVLDSQETNANPVMMIALMGDGLIGLVVEVWLIGALTVGGATAALGIIPSMEEATTMTVVVEWIVPFIWGISGLLFVEGAVMAYYVPMIPFILFVFGAIGWLIATVEAMVAAPLVALGITHPEGAEVLGKSDPAVLLLVNVFMRPSMMIIGFIAGIILSYVSIWLLNVGFLQFLLGGISGGPGGIMRLEAVSPIGMIFAIPFILVIYVALVISILNYCFALINVVPDKVLRWLGGQVEGVAGDAGRMAGEAKGAAQSAGKGLGDTIKDMAGKQGQKEDKSQSGEADIGDKGSIGNDSSKSESEGDSEGGGEDVEVSESGDGDKGSK